MVHLGACVAHVATHGACSAPCHSSSRANRDAVIAGLFLTRNKKNLIGFGPEPLVCACWSGRPALIGAAAVSSRPAAEPATWRAGRG